MSQKKFQNILLKRNLGRENKKGKPYEKKRRMIGIDMFLLLVVLNVYVEGFLRFLQKRPFDKSIDEVARYRVMEHYRMLWRSHYVGF